MESTNFRYLLIRESQRLAVLHKGPISRESSEELAWQAVENVKNKKNISTKEVS